MDQKLKGYTVRNAENKRRVDNNPRDNHVQQPPFKRKNVTSLSRSGTITRRAMPKSYHSECTLHRHGLCLVKCGNCKKVGHQARDGWTPTSLTCCECRGKGHTKRYWPELGNVNRDGKDCHNLDIVM
nr:hypothetical protein [Tanacetum cinerariifolium]